MAIVILYRTDFKNPIVLRHEYVSDPTCRVCSDMDFQFEKMQWGLA